MLQSTLRVIVLLLAITGVVLVVASICGKHWIQTAETYSGLWEVCNLKDKTCQEHDKFFLPAVRGFMSCGAVILGLVLFYYMVLISSPKAFNSGCLAALMGLGGVCILVGLSVYTYFDMDSFSDSIRYHWSFWVGWLGLLCDVIGTAMLIYDSRRPVSPFANAHRLK